MTKIKNYILKYSISSMLIFCIFLSVPIQAAAEATPYTLNMSKVVYGEKDKKIHILVKNYALDKIGVYLNSPNYQIKNIKSNNKDIKAWVARQTVINHEAEKGGIKEFRAKKVWIAVFANKQGKATVKFDICDNFGKRIGREQITVYASKESGIKSVKINNYKVKFQDRFKQYGKSGDLYTLKAKVKVALEKGYKLSKLEYESIQITAPSKQENIVKTKKLKNGDTIKLSKSQSDAEWLNITYTDKYTKKKIISKISLTY